MPLRRGGLLVQGLR